MDYFETRLFVSVLAALLAGCIMMLIRQAWKSSFDPSPCVCEHDRRDHVSPYDYDTRSNGGPAVVNTCRKCLCRYYITG